MSDIEVWAPYAGRVELVTAGKRQPMERAPDGWHVLAGGLDPGTDYELSLDGREPLPDPRSRWQPAGVHGASRVLDPSAFEWSDQGWPGMAWPDAVIYELHVGTFTPEGTFDAAAQRLGHLVELGVTAVEVMPVASFPGRHGWGYDGVDLWSVHEPYGGPAALARFVDAAHAQGLAVLLDVVYNHLGPDGNHLHAFGPYFTDRHRTPWGDAINLDGADAHEVRRFIVDNAVMWLRDYHLDGLRLDAVHALVDESPVHVMRELADAVAGLEPRRIVIAEHETLTPRIREWGLAGQWLDAWHHAVHVAVTGERSGYYESFEGLPNLTRLLEAARANGDAFVTFLQNHDQVGNRATGDRMHHTQSAARVMAGAALVLLGPFVPLIFQGEEWAASTPFAYFTDHGDADLGRRVSKGRRNEFAAFGWQPEDVPDPQDRATFAGSVLRWDELGEEAHASMLRWYRRLLAIRRSLSPDAPAAWHGLGAGAGVLDRGAVQVAVNLGTETVTVPRDGVCELLASVGTVELSGDEVRLQGDAAAVLG